MDRATRGLWTGVGGFALVPVTLLAVAAVPEGARVGVFLVGLLATAVVAARGGWIAKQALVHDAPHRGRAFVGAVLGLGIGLTAGMIALWAALGLALG
jgi:hypothetical protein